MRLKDGIHAMTLTGRHLVVVLGLAGLALTGCGGTTDQPGGDADAKVLSSIAGAMKAQGHDAQAGVARSSGARLTTVPAGFGGRWRVYQVDGGSPHPAQFTVGVGPDRVVLLTGNPTAFGIVAQAAGTRVTDTARAVALARTYLRVTRPTDVLTYTIEKVGQIRFRPNLTGADAAHRDAIVRKYRDVIAAPHAEKGPGGFTVTAYTVRDRTLQRRILEIGTTGTVKDEAKTLVDDLPVPYTM